MVEKFIKQIETIEKVEHWKPKKTKGREKIITRQSKAKTFKKWLQSSITLLHNDKNFEKEEELKFILEKYKFYTEKDQVYLEQWKSKSSLEVISHPEYFEVITYQRETKFEKPKKIVKEITKEEINKLIVSINRVNNGEPIPTRKIAEEHYKRSWNEILADRTQNGQQGLNIMLRLLAHYEWIVYLGGFTTILNEDSNIEEIIKKHLKKD